MPFKPFLRQARAFMYGQMYLGVFLGIGTMHAMWVLETFILHWSPVCRQKILASGSIGLCQLTRARLTSIATPIRRSITNWLDFRQFGGKTWFLQGLPLRGILLGKRQGLGLAWELVLLIILEQKLKECWQFFSCWLSLVALIETWLSYMVAPTLADSTVVLVWRMGAACVVSPFTVVDFWLQSTQ